MQSALSTSQSLKLQNSPEAESAYKFQHSLHDAKSVIGYIPELVKLSVDNEVDLPEQFGTLSAICDAVAKQIDGCLAKARDYSTSNPELVTSYLLGIRESICSKVSKILDIVEGLKVLSAEIKHDIKSSLDFTEEELNPESITPAEFQKILDRAFSLFGKGLRLYIDHDDSILQFDRAHLVRVLANLIGNARKYSHEGSTILVEVVRTGENVKIVFSDDGPGFEGDPDKLFGLHQQDKEVHQAQGFGIGLNYCKNIIEAHGGSITAKNKSNSPEWLSENGAIFEIVLPIRN